MRRTADVLANSQRAANSRHEFNALDGQATESDMMISQLKIEEIIRQIPAVQAALAEQDAEARKEQTRLRDECVSMLRAHEREAEKAEVELAAAKKDVADAAEKLAQANSLAFSANAKLSAARGMWSECLRRLEPMGNRVVTNTLVELECWNAHLGNLEIRATARVNDVVGFSFMPRFPQAKNELAAIHAMQKKVPRLRRVLEALLYASGHPDDIAAKAEIISSEIDPGFDPLVSQPAFPLYPTLGA